MTETEILYKQFRNLPVYKSKKFIDWLHQNYQKEVHHLIGSQGLKLNDYLCVPVDRQTHIQAEKDKQKFFVEQLPHWFSLICEYLQYLESKK